MVVRCGDGNIVIKLKMYNFTSTSDYKVLAHTLRILMLRATLLYSLPSRSDILYEMCTILVKIFKMSEDLLPHVCYGMLKGLYDCSRVTWASNMKILLCKVGFEYVWNAQGVQDENAFFCVFQDRIEQQFVTSCRNEVLNSRRLST